MSIKKQAPMNLSGQACKTLLKAPALGNVLAGAACPTMCGLTALLCCPHSQPHSSEAWGFSKWLFQFQLDCRWLCLFSQRGMRGALRSLEGQLYFQAEEEIACVKQLEGGERGTSFSLRGRVPKSLIFSILDVQSLGCALSPSLYR